MYETSTISRMAHVWNKCLWIESTELTSNTINNNRLRSEVHAKIYFWHFVQCLHFLSNQISLIQIQNNEQCLIFCLPCHREKDTTCLRYVLFLGLLHNMWLLFHSCWNYQHTHQMFDLVVFWFQFFDGFIIKNNLCLL